MSGSKLSGGSEAVEKGLGCLKYFLITLLVIYGVALIIRILEWSSKSFINSSVVVLSAIIIFYISKRAYNLYSSGKIRRIYLREIAKIRRKIGYRDERDKSKRKKVFEKVKPFINNKKYVLFSIFLVFILVSPALIGGSKTDNKSEATGAKNYGVSVPNNINKVKARHINGAYSSRYDAASDYWVNYKPKIATWEKIEEMNVGLPQWAKRYRDDYEGIIYWHEKGHTYKVQSRYYEDLTEEKYAWGVWRIGEKTRNKEEGNSAIKIKIRWNKSISKGFSRDDDIVTIWVYEKTDRDNVTLAWDTGLNADTFGEEPMVKEFWESNLK